MRIRKGLLVLAAVALPLASVALLEGTAFAGKVTGTGKVTCHFGGSINFNPPLTAAGSTSIKKETTTVVATLSSCSGGSVSHPAGSATVKPIKSKTTKGTAGGTCASFTNPTTASSTVVKVKISWTGEKPSKFTVNGLHAGAHGTQVGFTASGVPISGSYAGSGSLAVYLTQASTSKLLTCGSAISSLSLDSSISSSTL